MVARMVLATGFLLVSLLGAQEPWERMDYGPFLQAAVEAPRPAGNITRKGLVIPLVPRSSDAKLFTLLFDQELLRVSAVWEGEFLELRGVVFDGSHGTFPRTGDEVLWATGPRPGWGTGAEFEDPRPLPYGPLPTEWGEWRGVHDRDGGVILSYRIGEAGILERPTLDERDELRTLVRTFHVGPHSHPLVLELAAEMGVTAEPFADDASLCWFGKDDQDGVVAAIKADGGEVAWRRGDDHLRVELAPSAVPIRLRVSLTHGERGVGRALSRGEDPGDLPDLSAIVRQGPRTRRWVQNLGTRGELNVGQAADRRRIPVAASEGTQAIPVDRPSGWSTHFWNRDGTPIGVTFVEPLAETARVPSEEDLERGLLGHWSFDEGSGARARDLSSHGRHIEIERPAWRRGYRGRSAEFEGRTRAVIPEPDAVDFRDHDLTVATWLLATSDGTLLAKTVADGPWAPDGSTLFLRGGRLCYDVGWVGVVEAETPIVDGEWHHVSLTYRASDGRVELYVNGVREAAEVLKPKERREGRIVRLGFTNDNFPGPSWFNGRLDELRIYRRRLSEDEIAYLAGTHRRRSARAWTVREGPTGTVFRAGPDGRIQLHVPPQPADTEIELAGWNGQVEEPEEATSQLLEQLDRPQAPFLVDRITWPEENPWHAWMRFGGMDFFADGHRAALCTWSGDVWIVDGLDADLDVLKWSRIATGLHQALGLRIVEDRIYVLGRDQITRLHLHPDHGETVFYEAFNDDVMNHQHFHEFCMDLQTDAEGRFCFIKGARHGKDGLHPHHGTLLRVSADGRNLEVVARGHRASNGLAVGEDGWFYTTDQEGHWMPANRLNAVRAGGFYGNRWGYFPEGKPTTFEPPLCWVHPKVDRSPSEPLLVDSDRWGVPRGTLLHLSYGTGKIFRVLSQEIDGVVQGALTPLPITLPTGIHRGRFHPGDGQLYACGLFGWSSDATDPGGFYRVRTSGVVPAGPSGWRVRPEGIELTFTVPLDLAVAGLPERYEVESWDYRWSERYGSPDLKRDGTEGRDERPVESVQVSEDGRTVLLRIADLVPVMQIHIDINVADRTGQPLRTFVHGTVNRVP